MKVLRLLLLIAMIASCSGTKPIVVKLDYYPPEQAPAGAASRNVIVHLSPIVDARSNRDSLGMTTVSILPGSDPLAWIQSGLLTLADGGFDLNLSGSDPPDGYRIRAAVTRIYCRSTLTTLRSTVVLSIEYFRDGALLATREHRGEDIFEDNSTLKGSYRFNEGRVLQVLNNALADVVAQVGATIDELEAR